MFLSSGYFYFYLAVFSQASIAISTVFYCGFLSFAKLLSTIFVWSRYRSAKSYNKAESLLACLFVCPPSSLK